METIEQCIVRAGRTAVSPLLFRVSSAEQGRLHETLRRLGVRYLNASTDAAFYSACQTEGAGRPAVLIWEVSRSMPPRPRGIPDLVVHAALRTPLIIRAEISPAAMREIAAVARRERDGAKLDWQISLVGHDDSDLADLIAGILSNQRRDGAERAILSSISSKLPASVEGLVAGALVLAGRRLSAQSFARSLGVSLRTMESQLKNAHCPPPATLLAWGLVLYTAWRIDCLGLTPKQAAYSAGYRADYGVTALAEFVHRRCGYRLRTLRRPGAFAALLELFATSF